MSDFQLKIAKRFLKILRPDYVFLSVSFYFLGAGIFRYLGGRIEWNTLAVGLTFILLSNLSEWFLNKYFEYKQLPIQFLKTQFQDLTRDEFDYYIKALFLIGIMSFVCASVLFFSMIIIHSVNSLSIFVMSLIFLSTVAYSVPPIRLAEKGWGDILLVIGFAIITPAFAYSLQENGFHRLIAIISIPLFTLLLTTFISSGFPGYLQGMVSGKMSLLLFLQWNTGIVVHNILVLLTYLILGIGVLSGLPFPLALPFLIGLPFALISIYELSRIQNAQKPNWLVLITGSFGSIVCTLCLLLFALWTI
jgi:1,4-dihydroxy-2-naphthoate octaprenyltransferase